MCYSNLRSLSSDIVLHFIFIGLDHNFWGPQHMFKISNLLHHRRSVRPAVLGLSALFMGAVFSLTAVSPAQAANIVSSAQYLDVDANGTVERIRLTLDENVLTCVYEAEDWTINAAGTISAAAITGLSCAGNDAILDVLITADANITGGASDPVISYNNTDADDSVTLTSGAMTAKANLAGLDAAGPVALSAVYLDTDTNGVVNRVDILMSADLGLACTMEAGDWTFPAAGTINLTATTACAISGNYILLTVAGAAATTGGAVAPTVTYTDQGVANQVVDGATNDAVISAQTITDGAGPVAISATYLDTDLNGVVNRVDIVMTADTGLACTFEAGDWTFPAAGTVNLTAGTACAISGNTIRVTVAGAANTTGGAVAPTVTYTDQGTLNQVQDGSSNDIVLSGVTVADAAAPFILSTTPASTANGVAYTASIVVVFTEPMNTGSVVLTLSPTAGAIGYVWSNGNATATVSHATAFPVATLYTASVVGTDAGAGSLDVIAGISPLSWEFESLRRSVIPSQPAQTSTPSEPLTTEEPGTPATETPATEVPTTTPPSTITPEESTPGDFGISLNGSPINEGSLVKSAISSAVYYVDGNGMRHVFTTLHIYRSWYGDDFSSVVSVSAGTLAAMPLGKPVTFRPGQMIKLESDPKVYLVVEGHGLRHISSEAVAEGLFGSTWNKQIIEESVTAFISYVMLDPITTSGQIDMNALKQSNITISLEL